MAFCRLDLYLQGNHIYVFNIIEFGLAFLIESLLLLLFICEPYLQLQRACRRPRTYCYPILRAGTFEGARSKPGFLRCRPPACKIMAVRMSLFSGTTVSYLNSTCVLCFNDP